MDLQERLLNYLCDEKSSLESSSGNTLPGSSYRSSLELVHQLQERLDDRCRRLTDGKVMRGPAAAPPAGLAGTGGGRARTGPFRSALICAAGCSLLGTLREDGRSRQEFFVLTGVDA
jgi:hypothetical protein